MDMRTRDYVKVNGRPTAAPSSGRRGCSSTSRRDDLGPGRAHRAARPGTLAEARSLLYAVFDDMTEHDWEHSLGGIHALAYDGRSWSATPRWCSGGCVHGGRALRTGYVEGVGVRADRRRRGHASEMMEALERVIRDRVRARRAGATDDGGAVLRRARVAPVGRPLSALTPDGVVRNAGRAGRGLRAAGRRRAAGPVGRAAVRLARRRRLVRR
jgi:aminoglycoside 2'-N-acetyltransferase I